MPRLTLVVLALLASLVAPALADDWTAQKLRGTVLELVDGAWQKIERGAVVPETHVVRTLGNARVLFVRGSETVELGPYTQVAFHLRDSDRFTTVQQYFGEVTVEADVEKVKHFAVQTPHLVAVVKGTIFTVRSDEDGASVEVDRGAVAVRSTQDDTRVTVGAGQEASTSAGGTLEVSGEGTLPVVVDQSGDPVVDVAVAVDGTVELKTNNGKSGKDNSGNGKGKSADGGNGNSGQGNNGNSGQGNNGNNGKSGHGHGNDEDEGD
jgi:hypothetical protein